MFEGWTPTPQSRRECQKTVGEHRYNWIDAQLRLNSMINDNIKMFLLSVCFRLLWVCLEIESFVSQQAFADHWIADRIHAVQPMLGMNANKEKSQIKMFIVFSIGYRLYGNIFSVPLSLPNVLPLLALLARIANFIDSQTAFQSRYSASSGSRVHCQSSAGPKLVQWHRISGDCVKSNCI